jgi:hypothetical protein
MREPSGAETLLEERAWPTKRRMFSSMRKQPATTATRSESERLLSATLTDSIVPTRMGPVQLLGRVTETGGGVTCGADLSGEGGSTNRGVFGLGVAGGGAGLFGGRVFLTPIEASWIGATL